MIMDKIYIFKKIGYNIFLLSIYQQEGTIFYTSKKIQKIILKININY
jgi:hypothetical protein